MVSITLNEGCTLQVSNPIITSNLTTMEYFKGLGTQSKKTKLHRGTKNEVKEAKMMWKISKQNGQPLRDEHLKEMLSSSVPNMNVVPNLLGKFN